MGCVERGVLRDFTAGKLRLGKMTFTAICHCGSVYRMSLDVDAATLSFSGLFPGVSERSPLFKQLKNFLRPFTGDQVSAQLRVEPGKGDLQLLADNTGLTLVLRVMNAEFEYCAARMVSIAEEVARAFTRAGGHHYAVRPEVFPAPSGGVAHERAMERNN